MFAHCIQPFSQNFEICWLLMYFCKHSRHYFASFSQDSWSAKTFFSHFWTHYFSQSVFILLTSSIKKRRSFYQKQVPASGWIFSMKSPAASFFYHLTFSASNSFSHFIFCQLNFPHLFFNHPLLITWSAVAAPVVVFVRGFIFHCEAVLFIKSHFKNITSCSSFLSFHPHPHPLPHPLF